MWKGGWGTDAPRPAKITSIDLCETKGSKYGNPVKSVSWSLKEYIAVGLDNGHWAYGTQLEAIQ